LAISNRRTGCVLLATKGSNEWRRVTAIEIDLLLELDISGWQPNSSLQLEFAPHGEELALPKSALALSGRSLEP
jgi:hypothetical protein